MTYHSESFSNKTEEEKDQVINPSYYKIVGDYEYMDIMWAIMGRNVKYLLLGLVFKYLFRLGKKDAEEQDLMKTKWYLDYLLKVARYYNSKEKTNENSTSRAGS